MQDQTQVYSKGIFQMEYRMCMHMKTDAHTLKVHSTAQTPFYIWFQRNIHYIDITVA